MGFNFSNTPIGRLRRAGIVEGTSFLLLLFVAMPLKYFAGIPEAVKYTGWLHGVLFILFIYALIRVKLSENWPLTRMFLAFLASIVPFGTFIFDVQLRKEEMLSQEKSSKN